MAKKATTREGDGAAPGEPQQTGAGAAAQGQSIQSTPNPVVVPAITEVAHPATLKQKVILAALLIAVTIASLLMAWAALNSVQTVTYEPVRVAWQPVSDVRLATGPVGFRYDRVAGELQFSGPMSDETRLKLVALFPDPKGSSDDSAKALESDAASYAAAIDVLSGESLLLANKYVVALLLLGGCCGVVGVQLRSMWDFVRNICFKDPPQLDVVTWWPWYLMRPIIGFVLGVLAISMIMSGFLEVDNQGTRSSLWWLSITALVGFGASEFMSRLRLVVAALFAAQG